MRLNTIVPAILMTMGLGMACPHAFAADPVAPPAPSLTYQGRLVESNVPVTGARTFQFTLLNSADTVLWTSPDTIVTVTDGLYAVIISGFQASAIATPGLKLRVKAGSAVLSPDVALVPSLQAVTAFSVTPGAVGTDGLADGAVTTTKIPDGAVTAAKLAPGLITQDISFNVGYDNGATAGIALGSSPTLISASLGTPNPGESLDSANAVNNGVFTAPIDGLYILMATVTIGTVVPDAASVDYPGSEATLMKNGVNCLDYAYSDKTTVANPGAGFLDRVYKLHTVTRLAAGDTVAIYGSRSSGTAYGKNIKLSGSILR